VLLAELVRASRDVAATRARRAKVERLATCLRALASGEVGVAVAYLAGDLPQGRIGVGWAALRDAMPETHAERPTLELEAVDAAFREIDAARGAGSAGERSARLRRLLAAATPEEVDFLRRLLGGELRQGALAGVMVEGIARAARVDAAAVRRAAMLAGDLPAVARAALAHGAAGLAAFSLALFRPVQPMLAQSAADVPDALERLGPALLEWKLDGARIQVHRAGGDVRVFTRQGNDVTAAVPEVTEAVCGLPVRSIVLDGEAIALRPDGRPAPFQETMRRFGRRTEVEAMRAVLPVAPYFFDCLHLDGRDLLALAARERSRVLAGLLPAARRVPQLETDAPEAGAAFLAAALDVGHEGLVAKAVGAPYEAGRRGAAWLKVKPAHTLDLVVLAVEQGSGRRRGWLSNLHLGARDPQHGGFVMLGKTFKGLTDAMLAWQTERLGALAVAREGSVVYVRPELVVEVSFDGVQASPHYPAGLALRFARVKRHRPDKTAAQADSIDRVREIHRATGG
jgi:DNA ligase-1